MRFRRGELSANPIPRGTFTFVILSWNTVFLASLAALASSGCANRGGSAGNASLDAPGACAELSGKPIPGGSFTFAMTQPIDASRAPVPANDSEAILFSFLYENLVELNCRGEPRANLAKAWRYSNETGEWLFELEGALDATRVRRAWLTTRHAVDRGSDRDDEPSWVWESLHGRTLRADDEGRVIAITAGDSENDLPELLSLAAFGVAHRTKGELTPGAWPIGTRGFLETPPLDPLSQTGEGTLLWRGGGAGGEGPSEIRFLLAWKSDARDLVPSLADAVFVRDREVVRYYQEISGVVVTPLPWSRLYLLVTPEEVFAASMSAEVSRDLADNVVLAEAREAFDRTVEYEEILKRSLTLRPILPGQTGLSRNQLKDTVGRLGNERILYPEEDADAHAIAERIAFVRAAATGELPLVVGSSRERFLAELWVGLDTAYVVPIGPLVSERLKRQHLLRSAPWIGEVGAAVPLVETRGSLVTRAGLTGVYANYDGLPRLDRAGWTERRDAP